MVLGSRRNLESIRDYIGLGGRRSHGLGLVDKVSGSRLEMLRMSDWSFGSFSSDRISQSTNHQSKSPTTS